MNLKEKLIILQTSNSWHTKLSFDEILEICKKTKSFPVVPFKVKKYCYVYDITSYPLLNGKPLKLRNGQYGFYDKVIDETINLNSEFNISSLRKRIKTIHTNKSIFTLSLLNIISSKELLFINKKYKHLNPISINELIWLFYHNFNKRPICKLCGKELAVDRSNNFDRFCSYDCQRSVSGQALVTTVRENNNIKKYGVPYPHLMLGHKTISKWQRIICNKLKETFNDLKYCLEREKFLKVPKLVYYNKDQTFIQPDLIYNKKIIEFFGDFWHANPTLCEANTVIEWGVKAEDIWKRDQHRIKILKDMGYQVLIVWEKDFIDNAENTINRCIFFLNNK